MKNTDYNIVLKYSIKSKGRISYDGDSSIYLDGSSLEILPDSIDKVNGQEPLIVFGTVTYLHYNGMYLMLKQNKIDRVVDTVVGLGGKVSVTNNRNDFISEKTAAEKVVSSFELGNLNIEEDSRIAAAREVFEETSTYQILPDGKFGNQIIAPGIKINPNLLQRIGVSKVRIINQNFTEVWMIQNYFYDLSYSEYKFMVDSISKENREGNLNWYTLEDVLPLMSNVDQIILHYKSDGTIVSEIRDNVYGNNIVRCENRQARSVYTFIDGDLVFQSGISSDILLQDLPKLYRK